MLAFTQPQQLESHMLSRPFDTTEAACWKPSKLRPSLRSHPVGLLPGRAPPKPCILEECHGDLVAKEQLAPHLEELCTLDFSGVRIPSTVIHHKLCTTRAVTDHEPSQTKSYPCKRPRMTAHLKRPQVP